MAILISASVSGNRASIQLLGDGSSSSVSFDLTKLPVSVEFPLALTNPVVLTMTTGPFSSPSGSISGSIVTLSNLTPILGNAVNSGLLDLTFFHTGS